MNKRGFLLIVLIIAVTLAITLCGTVIAYMFRQTEYWDNQFTPAQVSCEVHETIDANVT